MHHLQPHIGSHSTVAAQPLPAMLCLHACLQAQRRLAGGCLAILVGRGALIKPWIWQELREGRELQPTAAERVGIYRQLVAFMRAGFGDDALGEPIATAWKIVVGGANMYLGGAAAYGQGSWSKCGFEHYGYAGTCIRGVCEMRAVASSGL